MALLKTKLFETIHPMTYLWAMQVIAWGVLILIHVSTHVDLLDVGELFWPESLTILWAVSLIVSGLSMLYLFIRDERGKKRTGLIIAAKVNLSIWAFAAVVWFSMSAEAFIMVSLFNIASSAYLAIAASISPRRARI